MCILYCSKLPLKTGKIVCLLNGIKKKETKTTTKTQPYHHTVKFLENGSLYFSEEEG